MLSCKDVMTVMGISKSLAYDIMNRIPHLDSPVRVWERDLKRYIEDRMIYPIECKKRRAAL